MRVQSQDLTQFEFQVATKGFEAYMQATSRKINGWRMFGIQSQKKISYIHTAGVRSQQE